MRRINIRRPDEWRAFDRMIAILLIILAIVLLILWLSNRDLLLFNCCDAHSEDSEEQIAETAPLVDPEPEPAPEPVVPPAAVPTEPPELGISVADSVVVLNGVVDSDATKKAIVDRVEQSLPTLEIRDQIRVRDDVVPLAGIDSLEDVLSQFSGEDRLSVAWEPQSIRVAGVVETEERKQTILGLARGNALTTALYGDVDLIDQVQVAKRGPSCAQILQGAQVEFSSGSATLRESGKIELSKLVPCLQATTYKVVGHTDSDGDETANEALSLARAQSAIDFLVGQGERASKFEASGAGETKPIADNSTAAGKARNRRIEFQTIE